MASFESSAFFCLVSGKFSNFSLFFRTFFFSFEFPKIPSKKKNKKKMTRIELWRILISTLHSIELVNQTVSNQWIGFLSFLFSKIASCDVGFAIYTRYAIESTTAPSISYIAHLTGALAGLTIGLLVLKSFEQKLHEQLIWWIALGVYSACSIFAIVYNLLNTITAQKLEENEEVLKEQLLHGFGIWKWKQWSELWMNAYGKGSSSSNSNSTHKKPLKQQNQP